MSSSTHIRWFHVILREEHCWLREAEIFLSLSVKIHEREEERKHGKAREKFCACVCVFFLELPGLCVVVLTRYSLICMRMGKEFNISWVPTGH